MKKLDMDVDGILSRMMSVLGVKTDTALCDLIGEAKTTVSSWRVRRRMPEGKIRAFASDHDLDMGWLITGAYPQNKIASDAKNNYSIPPEIDADVDRLKTQMAERDEVIKSLTQQVKYFQERLAKADDRVDELIRQVGERQAKIAHLEEELIRVKN